MVRFKLSAMMFLEFFIWGAWYPLIFGYLPSLGFTEAQQPWILGAFNLAAFTAMFFSTQFADRNFAAERFMAFSQLVGGLAILALAWIQRPSPNVSAPFWPFFLLILTHSLFYVPTISIANSIAFTHLKSARDFGIIRLWGTIGWVAAAWPFVFILVDWAHVPAFGSVPFLEWLSTALGTPKTGDAFRQATSASFIVAGVASLLLAVFSLALPHTPPTPRSQGGESLAWLEAMMLLRKPFLLVLFIVTFIDAAVHQCYFFWTERYLTGGVGIASNWVTPIMSVGQIAEIGAMALLGFALKNLGWRATMTIGILGHAARFAVFAFFPYASVAILINLLHGICYAFFFATVYIFVDEFFPKDARSSAQGLFNFLILGLGPFVGNFAWAQLGDMYKSTSASGAVVYDFRNMFLVPAGIALAAAVILVLFFHPPKKAEEHAKHVDDKKIGEAEATPAP